LTPLHFVSSVHFLFTLKVEVEDAALAFRGLAALESGPRM
jgi:hypothetical protein